MLRTTIKVYSTIYAIRLVSTCRNQLNILSRFTKRDLPKMTNYSVTEFSKKYSTSVKNDRESGIFYVEIDGMRAYLEYEEEDNLVILIHTEVPSELGGRGIGKLLAKEALEYVAKNDFKLEIHCDFVRNFVNKYEPKYLQYIDN